MYISEKSHRCKAIDDKLEWIRTKAGDDKAHADEAHERGLRKVPGSGSLNRSQPQSGYVGSGGKVSGVMVPSSFGTKEVEEDEDAIPKKQIKVDGTVLVVAAEDATTASAKEAMAVDVL